MEPAGRCAGTSSSPRCRGRRSLAIFFGGSGETLFLFAFIRQFADEIRELVTIVAMMPRTHGSGLFQRGSTQVLSSVTLGAPCMEQTLDTMEFQATKRFFHHYNFPSYSVGETKGNRGPGRREIGHGALAERALLPVMPEKEKFPYTIRIVSEVLGSNGSSSMGATCGSTLALMDAGVPILAPVAGIAMGLASDEDNAVTR